MSIIDLSNAMARQEDSAWNPQTLSWSSFNPNSLAQKNNNPGNLRFAGQAGAVQGAGGFAKFDNPEDGFQALQNQLALYANRDDLSLSQAINRYAPPSDHNETSTYLSNVMRWLGLSDPNIKLSEVIGGGGVDATADAPDIQASVSPFGDLTDESGSVNWGMVGLIAMAGIVLYSVFKN